jgi:hypothetical protein
VEICFRASLERVGEMDADVGAEVSAVWAGVGLRLARAAPAAPRPFKAALRETVSLAFMAQERRAAQMCGAGFLP